MKELRKTFLTGLVFFIPIVLTLFLLQWLFTFFDNLLGKPINTLFHLFGIHLSGDPIPGIGLVLLLFLILLTGILARNYIGGKLLAIGEKLLASIPFVNRIYLAIREISQAVLSEKRELFHKAVLIEYPRRGIYSIGFLTQDTTGPVQNCLDEDVVSLFLPSTPNPTTGFLLFVPKNQLIPLDMRVEDALKLIISGGAIHLNSQKAGLTPNSRKAPKGKERDSQASPFPPIS